MDTDWISQSTLNNPMVSQHLVEKCTHSTVSPFTQPLLILDLLLTQYLEINCSINLNTLDKCLLLLLIKIHENLRWKVMCSKQWHVTREIQRRSGTKQRCILFNFYINSVMLCLSNPACHSVKLVHQSIIVRCNSSLISIDLKKGFGIIYQLLQWGGIKNKFCPDQDPFFFHMPERVKLKVRRTYHWTCQRPFNI